MQKISIITVTYNCKDDFAKTLSSIKAQDYPSIEYIVIDGGSTDGTAELIKQNDSFIDYWVSEKDDGIYFAMNKGLDSATGDWVIMFNAGDVFYAKDTLSQMFSRDLSKVDVFYGDCINILSTGPRYEKADMPFFLNSNKLHGMGFSHQSVFVRTELARRQKYDTSFRCCADYAHMVSLYESGARFYHIDIPVEIAEGRYGFSERNRSLQMLEEAKICNIDHELWFKLHYLKCTIVRWIKQHVLNG